MNDIGPITLEALPGTPEYLKERDRTLREYRGRVAALLAAPPQIFEKFDPNFVLNEEGVAFTLYEMYACNWHRNSRVKAGVRARHCVHCHKAGVVLGVDRDGIFATYVSDDDPGFIQRVPLVMLGPTLPGQRLPLDQYGALLLRLAGNLRGDAFTVAKTLEQLFACPGGYMPRNIVGEAWMFYALCLLGQWKQSSRFTQVIEALVEDALVDGIDIDLLPPALVRVQERPDAENLYTSHDMTPDQIEEAYVHCLHMVEERALPKFIEDAKAYEAKPVPQFAPGSIAWWVEGDKQVVVLSEAGLGQDPAFIAVASRDDGGVRGVHATTLEPEDEMVDGREILSMIEKNGHLDLLLCLCNTRLVFKNPVPAQLKVVVNIAAYRSHAETGNPKRAKEFLLRAKALMKELASAEKSKVFALAPELLPPKKGEKVRPRGSLDGCATAILDLLKVFYALENDEPTKETCRDEPGIAQGLAPGHEPNDQKSIPSNASPAAEDQGSPPDTAPEQSAERETGALRSLDPPASIADDTPEAASDEPPATEATTEQDHVHPLRLKRPSSVTLRFPFKEHKLQALEWSLVSGENSFADAVASTLKWLGARLGTTLPQTWSLGGHELELGGVRLEIEAGKGVFAFRLEHPDRELLSRTWRLESMLIAGPAGNTPMVGVRVSALDRATDVPRPFTGVPALTGAWQESPGLLIGDVLSSQSTQVRTEEDFNRWVAEVLAPKRTYVMTATLDPSGFLPPSGMTAVIKRGTFTGPAAALYVAKYGAPRAGTVHVFKVGNPGPTSWLSEDRKALHALGQEATNTRQRPDTPTFKQIRDLLRDTRPRAAAAAAPTEAAELAPAADLSSDSETIERMAAHRTDELQSMLDMALEDNDQRHRELQQSKADLAAAHAKIIALQAQLALKGVPTAMSAVKPPERLVDLPDWVGSLAPRVVIAEKALRVAARTEHKEPGKIIAALQALSDHYWPSRFGDDPDAYERWQNFIYENRLRWGPVGMASDIERYAGQYQCVVDGVTYTATHHIQGSSSRDPTRCIRIYVAIDQERLRVVVCHAPTHLDNTLT